MEIDSERMLVTDADTVNKTASVVRGWDETTPAAHTAGAKIVVGPRGDRGETLNLINDCLADLFPDLYKVSVAEINYSGLVIGYEIPATAHRILAVNARMDSGSSLWENISDWHVDDNASAEFTTGKSIMIRVALPHGSIIRVKYGSTFTPASSEADDLITTCGLSDYMVDLPYYYALSRLLPAEETLRSQIKAAEGHQRAQDTPAFLAIRTGEWYSARYQERKTKAVSTQAFMVKKSIGVGYGS